MRLPDFFRRLGRSAPAADETPTRRGTDHVDDMAATTTRGEQADSQGGELPGTVPPSYIKTYDEGRPRH